MKKFLLLFLAGLLLAVAPASANNLRVSLLNYGGPTNNVMSLLLNVSWENSWRDANNWDAAWVFVKYRAPGGVWRTATLRSTDAGHVAPSGTTLSAAPDGKGVMLYRSSAGSGTLNATALILRWDLAADGIGNQINYEVKALGVEMVYVPQGGFNLNAQPQAGQSNEFIGVGGSLTSISSEAALPAGALRWQNETGGGGTGNQTIIGTAPYEGSDALPAAYPKGFADAYCMKYEISQGQYTDFLNMLTRAQQIRRVSVNISGDSPASGMMYVMADAATAGAAQRNTITCPASGMGTTQPVTFSCARPDRAGNFLIWADGAAYLDWAGLRPMSELEYEKICRGPMAAIPNEFAWGSTTIGRAANIFPPSPLENGTETTDATANCVYNVSGGSPFIPFVGGDGGDGPLRCGIFARAATSREQAGATYYGVMEMSGNCWERCVTVAGTDGGQPTNAAAFDRAQNGDGLLDAAGDHNVLTWPNSTDVRGSNYRGGNWSRQAAWSTVADRTYGGNAISGRTAHRSIRGVRSGSTLNAPAPLIVVGDTPAKFYGGSYDGYASSTGLVVTASRAGAALAQASLAPNPLTEAATLTLTNRAALTNATLTLRDALGRVVRQQEHLHGLEIGISRGSLPAGLYFVEVQEGGAQVMPVLKLEVR